MNAQILNVVLRGAVCTLQLSHREGFEVKVGFDKRRHLGLSTPSHAFDANIRVTDHGGHLQGRPRGGLPRGRDPLPGEPTPTQTLA